mmetsp:Transcript_22055/g.61377  ORF Transcript_22055/g.61377 Transcript_22055/m.61377 type:complete len:257 (-) Transcript_22055:186-956(-)
MRSSQLRLAASMNFTKPIMPSKLFQNPIKNERNEKKVPELVDFDFTALSFTMSLPSSPSSLDKAGTLATQGRIHFPFTMHSQVPHSPLPQPYLMNCPACVATSRYGCPTHAMLVRVSLPCWKTTGMSPFKPTLSNPSCFVEPKDSATVVFLVHFGTYPFLSSDAVVLANGCARFTGSFFVSLSLRGIVAANSESRNRRLTAASDDLSPNSADGVNPSTHCVHCSTRQKSRRREGAQDRRCFIAFVRVGGWVMKVVW